MPLKSSQLYGQLINLVNEQDSPFYLQEREGFDRKLYHVFSYRLASYTNFLNPGALECRGHTFRIENHNAELVSLPFPKFFNLNENPFTMDLDFSNDNISYIATKEDGSLISSYLDSKGILRLKSKTSLDSAMALASMNLLDMKVYYNLATLIRQMEEDNNTVIMEWVSPANRIVLPYDESALIVLGIRNKNTLEHLSFDEMVKLGFEQYLVENHLPKISNVSDFVDSIPDMKGIEGYVIALKDGTMIKVKTDEYVSLHHAKDSINSTRRLFEVVLNEAGDDLRNLFDNDEQALSEITNMEEFVSHRYNALVKKVETFYNNNKTLERKEYAIKGQKELEPNHFKLAMMKYTGKDISYKDFMIKRYKDYLAGYKTTLQEDIEE